MAIFSDNAVSTSEAETVGKDAGYETIIGRVLTCPECDILKLYARLSPAQQWEARKRATGNRRAALVQCHALEFALLR